MKLQFEYSNGPQRQNHRLSNLCVWAFSVFINWCNKTARLKERLLFSVLLKNAFVFLGNQVEYQSSKLFSSLQFTSCQRPSNLELLSSLTGSQISEKENLGNFAIIKCAILANMILWIERSIQTIMNYHAERNCRTHTHRLPLLTNCPPFADLLNLIPIQIIFL